MKQQLLAAGIAISSCLVSLEARAASFTGLNVFGDSLVDTGNLFNVTSTLGDPLGLPGLPPSPPYAERSSNGPIWIDNLAQVLGLSPSLSTDLILNPPIFPPTQGINFAFGGALSSDAHIVDDDLPPFLANLFPGFQNQIDTFTTLSTVLFPDPTDLYVVWVGGNDYNDAFFDLASLAGLSLVELPNVVTDNILDGLIQLSNLGAKEFLVVNLPSLGEAPFADTLDADFPQDIPQILNRLSFAHNQLLSAKLNIFSQRRPDANIITLDINTLFDNILADPGSFGLTNVTESCLINFQPGFQFEGICDNPDEYLWWDDTHPTTAAYEIISDFALATLSHGVTSTALNSQAAYTTLSSDFALATLNNHGVTSTSVPEPRLSTAILAMLTLLPGVRLRKLIAWRPKFRGGG